MDKVKTISRRSALAGMALAGAATLSACSGGSDGTAGGGAEWDGSYLPVGSVVHLTGWPDHMKLAIVARKPYFAGDGSGDVADYAGISSALGILGDLSGADSCEGEVVMFDAEDIDACLHMGYVDDVEQDCKAALDAAADENLPALAILEDVARNYYGTGEGEGDE